MESGEITEEKSDLRARKIHERYLGLICCILLAYLATVKVGSEPTVTAYITFAATVSSLILAVLAIFITLTGNTEIARNMASLSFTTRNLDVASSKLLDGTTEFGKTSVEVQAGLIRLQELMEEVGTKVYGRIERLALELPSTQQAMIGNAESAPANHPNDELATPTQFLRSSSAAGLLLLHVAARLAGTHRSFNFRELAERISFTNPDYFWGYMVAASAAGLLTFSSPKDSVFEVDTVTVSLEDVEMAIGRWTDIERTKAAETAKEEAKEEGSATPSKTKSAADLVEEMLIQAKNFTADLLAGNADSS